MAHLTYPLQPDAKERYSDGRLHQRNGCRSWLKKSETNILLVPDPPPQTKLGKCVITKQGFLDTLYILTFFALVFWEGKARQASKRDAWSPSETQDHNARSHLHLLAYTVQDHLLRFELSLSNSFPPLSKLPRPPNIENFGYILIYIPPNNNEDSKISTMTPKSTTPNHLFR